jgi:hypothetical protein
MRPYSSARDFKLGETQRKTPNSTNLKLKSWEIEAYLEIKLCRNVIG